MIVFIFSGNRRINIGSTEPNTRITKEGIRRIPTSNVKSCAEINSFRLIIMFISGNNRVISVGSIRTNARIMTSILGLTQISRY